MNHYTYLGFGIEAGAYGTEPEKQKLLIDLTQSVTGGYFQQECVNRGLQFQDGACVISPTEAYRPRADGRGIEPTAVPSGAPAPTMVALRPLAQLETISELAVYAQNGLSAAISNCPGLVSMYQQAIAMIYQGAPFVQMKSYLMVVDSSCAAVPRVDRRAPPSEDLMTQTVMASQTTSMMKPAQQILSMDPASVAWISGKAPTSTEGPTTMQQEQQKQQRAATAGQCAGGQPPYPTEQAFMVACTNAGNAYDAPTKSCRGMFQGQPVSLMRQPNGCVVALPGAPSAKMPTTMLLAAGAALVALMLLQ